MEIFCASLHPIKPLENFVGVFGNDIIFPNLIIVLFKFANFQGLNLWRIWNSLHIFTKLEEFTNTSPVDLRKKSQQILFSEY